MALERAVRTYEPTLPGIAAFLQTKDLLSLLTVLERKALEGDEEAGRREESFHPLPSSRLIERLTSQCVELKLKATPKYHLGSVTVQDTGHDGLTRRQLNGINAAIQAIPLWFPSETTEFVKERILKKKKKKVVVRGPRLVVTNRSATDGAVDFFAPSVPCQVTVSPASPCSGKVCQMTSLLLCSCCEEGLCGCGQCAIECPFNYADCTNELICPGCSVFSPPDAEYRPGLLLGCLDCHFQCVACNRILTSFEKVQCDNEACTNGPYPTTNTCGDCAELDGGYFQQCLHCKGYKCEDCERMKFYECCSYIECQSCAKIDGKLQCAQCGDSTCPSCIKDQSPCTNCGKYQCMRCDENMGHFEKCERCRKRCCSDCVIQCGFGGCQGQNSSLCKNCTQDEETCHKCGAWACYICSDKGYCDWYEDDNYEKMHCNTYGDTDAEYDAARRKLGHCSRCDKFFCPVSCNRYCDTCQAGVCEACHAAGCFAPPETGPTA